MRASIHTHIFTHEACYDNDADRLADFLGHFFEWGWSTKHVLAKEQHLLDADVAWNELKQHHRFVAVVPDQPDKYVWCEDFLHRPIVAAKFIPRFVLVHDGIMTPLPTYPVTIINFSAGAGVFKSRFRALEALIGTTLADELDRHLSDMMTALHKFQHTPSANTLMAIRALLDLSLHRKSIACRLDKLIRPQSEDSRPERALAWLKEFGFFESSPLAISWYNLAIVRENAIQLESEGDATRWLTPDRLAELQGSLEPFKADMIKLCNVYPANQ